MTETELHRRLREVADEVPGPDLEIPRRVVGSVRRRIALRIGSAVALSALLVVGAVTATHGILQSEAPRPAEPAPQRAPRGMHFFTGGEAEITIDGRRHAETLIMVGAGRAWFGRLGGQVEELSFVSPTASLEIRGINLRRLQGVRPGEPVPGYGVDLIVGENHYWAPDACTVVLDRGDPTALAGTVECPNAWVLEGPKRARGSTAAVQVRFAATAAEVSFRYTTGWADLRLVGEDWRERPIDFEERMDLMEFAGGLVEPSGGVLDLRYRLRPGAEVPDPFEPSSPSPGSQLEDIHIFGPSPAGPGRAAIRLAEELGEEGEGPSLQEQAAAAAITVSGLNPWMPPPPGQGRRVCDAITFEEISPEAVRGSLDCSLEWEDPDARLWARLTVSFTAFP
jgi:hypothetical protein